MYVVWFLVGLLMLLGGADALVRGGGGIALALRVPVIVVALTIVAFGTSMPEILVSVTAATRGSSAIALGNIIGSNIANIALVLGAAALVAPITVGRELMRREIPTLVILQMLLPLMLLDGAIGRYDGIALLGVGIAYNAMLLRDALAGRTPVPDDEVPSRGDMLTNGALLLLGLALLFVGADLFVEGAVEFATVMGIDERVIGLTVVALGTSAPEVVTAVVSAFRNENDMAVGNALGSNVLNVSLALALTAIITPIEFRDSGTWKDLSVAMLVTLLLVPMILRGRHISRVEGGMLVAAYLIYIIMLSSF